ncbi:MAG: hypothetical protein HC802_18325 [Caldilineaceae bacterium]|nr:hypothetical protein [Caldilineaceae bacterium]
MRTLVRQGLSFLAGGLIVAAIVFYASQANAQPEASSAGQETPNLVNVTLDSTPRIKYQGQLLDSTGKPKSGVFNMTFTIYDESTVVRWQETRDVTINMDGLFSVQLGASKSILVDSGGNTLFPTGENRYLGVTIAGETIGSPELINYVPLATNSAMLEGKTKDYFAEAKFGARSFGVVEKDGSKKSGLHFSSSRKGVGTYEIEIKKGSSSESGTYDYNLNDFTTVVTPVRNSDCNFPTTAGTNSEDDKLVVQIYRPHNFESLVDCKFHFVVFWDGSNGG